eukprot:CAMPEP_0197644288 /NCGR_PEP_ID=MMETSP1338-20131121/17313_1 /TAXON_ID=43686 ORGANISM="Pelagodinium beii, Strain RCC1491" /NCGR_SAMPLE_ID=MMETSP1338 /ASSEMBLY_ACC=CAM_ASM_000754 /LENGTH=146 /DNA_ID=CAMNT_0043217659 /DNA_START=63 /DNA_END=503 /DNA_ORIENTATION=+
MAHAMKAMVFMQALLACRGSDDIMSTSNRSQSSFITANESAVFESVSQAMPRSLRGHEGCKTVSAAWNEKCACVDDTYVDKCKGCMCFVGSTSWCNTACDPTGSGAARDNSCCRPFKKEGATCGHRWECEPGPYTCQKGTCKNKNN